MLTGWGDGPMRKKKQSRPAGDRAECGDVEKTGLLVRYYALSPAEKQPISCRPCLYFRENRLPSGGLRRLCRFTGEKNPMPCRDFRQAERGGGAI